MHRLAIRAERDEAGDARRLEARQVLAQRRQVEVFVLVEEGRDRRVDALDVDHRFAFPALAVTLARRGVLAAGLRVRGREATAGSLPAMCRKRIAWRIRW